MKDYYEILGVTKTATKEEVKKAYYRLSQKHHPDKGGKDEDFQAISLAYEILMDDEKRAKYDRGEPVFDNSDPEAFIRGRAIQLFMQFADNKNIDIRRTDIFKAIINQCKVTIEQAPIAERNANHAIKRYNEILSRIEGENSQLYVHELKQRIAALQHQLKKIPMDVEQYKKIIKFIEKTKYRTDEMPQNSGTTFRTSFPHGGTGTGY